MVAAEARVEGGEWLAVHGCGGGDDAVYVRKAGDAQAWLAKGRLTVNRDALQWLEREVTNVTRERVREAVRELKEAGVQAIAICFLFSYLDASHEARALEIVREEYPACFATTSSSVSPQFREFERFTTTAMNAFVGPKVRNVPKEGYYAWDPGGYIGLYQPDTFWIAQ